MIIRRLKLDLSDKLKFFEGLFLNNVNHFTQPTTIHTPFLHKGQCWDITVSVWCGVYKAIIECEGIEVEKRIIAPTRDIQNVIKDLIKDKFGAYH
jgi:hypothetical protein